MSDRRVCDRLVAVSLFRNEETAKSVGDIVDNGATGRESRRTAKRVRYYTVTYHYFYKKVICI
ncbi:MAG: hypothetical protein K2G90_09360 [Muribaculaceae bacterium]|nr:hypothetical protein [Muribaculaceae bacterium]